MDLSFWFIAFTCLIAIIWGLSAIKRHQTQISTLSTHIRSSVKTYSEP